MKFSIPEGLSAESSRFIGDVIRMLTKERQIQNVDHGTLKMLVISYETYLKASQIAMLNPVVKNYRDEYIPNPAATVAAKNFNQAMAAMIELGITLKARTKGQKKSDDEDNSPLGQFFKER